MDLKRKHNHFFEPIFFCVFQGSFQSSTSTAPSLWKWNVYENIQPSACGYGCTHAASCCEHSSTINHRNKKHKQISATLPPPPRPPTRLTKSPHFFSRRSFPRTRLSPPPPASPVSPVSPAPSPRRCSLSAVVLTNTSSSSSCPSTSPPPPPPCPPGPLFPPPAASASSSSSPPAAAVAAAAAEPPPSLEVTAGVGDRVRRGRSRPSLLMPSGSREGSGSLRSWTTLVGRSAGGRPDDLSGWMGSRGWGRGGG